VWDVSEKESCEIMKVLRSAGGPPGSRSQRVRIKRVMHLVGLVLWARNHPDFKENLSGSAGLVCGMKCGTFHFCDA
jgi:hypothetical protein